MSAPDPTGGVVERSTVGWTAKGVRARSIAQQLAEESRSQVANKGVELYAWVLQTVADGGEVFVRLPGESTPRSVLILGMETGEPHDQGR